MRAKRQFGWAILNSSGKINSSLKFYGWLKKLDIYENKPKYTLKELGDCKIIKVEIKPVPLER